jgi:1-acyl-sn-glycerol-3-phosphate acyltransferase
MATIASLEDASYSTHPHTWQTQLWARVARRIGRHWVISRHVKRHCQPFTIEGRDAIKGVKGPALIIANHSSHFDTPAAVSALPERLRSRTAVAAAADRFYKRTKRGWWYSLFFNTFPIERHGGGSATLAYPTSLLRQGWSVLIYPEGTRSTNGQLGSFHHGVALMATQAKVPVIPIYTHGLREVMPKGQRSPRPAAVHVRIGAPVWVGDAPSIPEATARLEEAMRALIQAPPIDAREAPAALELAGVAH